MVAVNISRVQDQTNSATNERIERETVDRLRHYQDYPEEIPVRLAELDEEWDIERVLEMNAAALAFSGIVLGVTEDRRWLGLSAAVAAFLFQHAVQGWCPPVPVLRRFGFRTVSEIERERYALRAIRGDFAGFDRGAGSLTELLRVFGFSGRAGV